MPSWGRLGAFWGVLGRLGRRLVSMWANKLLLGLQMAQKSSPNHPKSSQVDTQPTARLVTQTPMEPQRMLSRATVIRPFKRLSINEIENMSMSVLRGGRRHKA